jgi:hypothetical protein
MTGSERDSAHDSTEGGDHGAAADPGGPSLTIVGGQPTRMRSAKVSRQSPSGIEELLRAAVLSPDLRDLLLKDRASAVAKARIQLTHSEQDALASISDAVMISMLDAMEQQLRPRMVR